MKAVQSMTGVGLGKSRDGLIVELKSTNARGLDLIFKLPEGFLSEEEKLRRLLQKKFSRGRIELRCYGRGGGAFADRDLIALDRELRGDLKTLGREREKIPLDVLFSRHQARKPPFPDSAELRALGLCVKRAVAQLEIQRHREGTRLKRDLIVRLGRMKRLIQQGRVLARKKARQSWNRIQVQIRTLLEGREDRTQLATEKALVFSRADVSEETTRIFAHLDESCRALTLGGAVGRKLNFLCQELHREIQTFTDKSQDLKIARLGVTLKEILEQVREQVQNLE